MSGNYFYPFHASCSSGSIRKILSLFFRDLSFSVLSVSSVVIPEILCCDSRDSECQGMTVYSCTTWIALST